MHECPIARLSNWRFGSRRDETRRDDARHGATRGMEFDEELAEEQARRQNEVYVALIRELERVPDDARGAVASFLQDLRRDGVDWYRVGDGGEFDVDDKESFFRTVHAGACMRAARIMGSGCLKFAREHVAPWDEWTCAFAAMNGNLDCLKYAHEHGCPWNEETCACAAYTGHLGCLKYAQDHSAPESARYVVGWQRICACTTDLIVQIALSRQRDGYVSLRELTPAVNHFLRAWPELDLPEDVIRRILFDADLKPMTSRARFSRMIALYATK